MSAVTSSTVAAFTGRAARTLETLLPRVRTTPDSFSVGCRAAVRGGGGTVGASDRWRAVLGAGLLCRAAIALAFGRVSDSGGNGFRWGIGMDSRSSRFEQGDEMSS
ncbi:MAG TPA: hypothetical protein VK841_06405 [Polyangiaceae bacterium]|nr:hypothetical protein [Polyangiaceae bacterium]